MKIPRLRNLELAWPDVLSSDIWPQNLWDHHRSVCLLKILYDGYPGTANSQATSVEGVHVFRFALTFRPVPDVSPPRLVGRKVGARRNLPEELLPRQPNLDVISFSGRGSQICCAECNHPVVNAELLQNGFRMMRELLQFIV